jgi:Ca2+-binding RTX toxin-like protein
VGQQAGRGRRTDGRVPVRVPAEGRRCPVVAGQKVAGRVPQPGQPDPVAGLVRQPAGERDGGNAAAAARAAAGRDRDARQAQRRPVGPGPGRLDGRRGDGLRVDGLRDFPAPARARRLEGTAAADSVTVTESGATRVRAFAKGVVKHFPKASVSNVAGVRNFVVDPGVGNDLVKVDAFGRSSLVHGGDGDDALTGGAAEDLVEGGRGDDAIRALGGDDDVYGGAGDDTIDGGLGADLLAGDRFDAFGDFIAGPGTDTVTYAARSAEVTVVLDDGNPGNGEAGEGDYPVGFAVAVGGSPNDVLGAGASVAAAVKLLGGADALDGGTGRDGLFGPGGNDTLPGEDGFVDHLDGGAGTHEAQKDPDDATSGVEGLVRPGGRAFRASPPGARRRAGPPPRRTRRARGGSPPLPNPTRRRLVPVAV